MYHFNLIDKSLEMKFSNILSFIFLSSLCYLCNSEPQNRNAIGKTLPRLKSVLFSADNFVSEQANQFGTEKNVDKSYHSFGINHTLLLFLSSSIYGISHVVTKLLLQDISSNTINVLRFLLASLLFLPDLLKQKLNIKVLLAGLELGFWCALGFMSQGIALKDTSVGKAALFGSLVVIICPILEKIGENCGLQEKKHKNNIFQFISPILAFIGAGVIEWGGLEPPKWQDTMLLLTPLSFSICFWRSEKFALQFPQEAKSLTGLMLSSASVLFLLYAWIQQGLPVNALACFEPFLTNKFKLLLLIFHGVIATGVTAWIELEALHSVSASETALIYSSEPLFSVLFARLFLSEEIGIHTILGAFFIIVGCILNQFVSQ